MGHRDRQPRDDALKVTSPQAENLKTPRCAASTVFLFNYSFIFLKIFSILEMSLEERSSNHELQEYGNDGPPEIDSASALTPLPQADGGKAAWLFLLGSFMIEMVLWGDCSCPHRILHLV